MWRIAEHLPRHCFLMTKLGEPPDTVRKMRRSISAKLKKRGYTTIDAESAVTGGSMLEKIWHLLENTPVAIAVCCRGMRSNTLANIFYELGVAQAMGSETLIVKTPDFKVPSDFAGLEYIVLMKSSTLILTNTWIIWLRRLAFMGNWEGSWQMSPAWPLIITAGPTC